MLPPALRLQHRVLRSSCYTLLLYLQRKVSDMAFALQSARLRYLHDAADLVVPRSSTVAAVLGAEIIRITDNANLNLPEARKPACRACGNFPHLDHPVEARPETSNAKRRVRQVAKKKKPSTVVKSCLVACTRCKKRCRVSPAKVVQPAEAAMHPKETLAVDMASVKDETSTISAQDSVSTVVIPMAEAFHIPKSTSDVKSLASKQRARSKKQSNLQVLLARNKAASSAGGGSTGFDLMDFMKTG